MDSYEKRYYESINEEDNHMFELYCSGIIESGKVWSLKVCS